MSTRFLDALHTGRVILMDGAMGTELIRRGLDAELERADEWNTTHAEEVREVHKAYLDAGACCLVTNTFLGHLGFPDSMPYPSGIRLAQSAGDGTAFVLLDCGPAQQWYAGAEAILAASNHAKVCDGVLAETQRAVQAIRYLANQPAFASSPCLVSFCFARKAVRGLCLEDDSTPEEVAGFIQEHRDRFAALGVNCGRDMSMDDIIEVVRRYRKVTDLPILARPNAGTPIRMGDQWVYPHSPSSMAAKLPELIEAGATLIGGCCGTTPAHIAAFREVIERLGVGWKPG